MRVAQEPAPQACSRRTLDPIMKNPWCTVVAALIVLTILGPCSFVSSAEEVEQKIDAAAVDEPHLEHVLDTLLKTDIALDEPSMVVQIPGEDEQEEQEEQKEGQGEAGDKGGEEESVIASPGNDGAAGTHIEEADVATPGERATATADNTPDIPVVEEATDEDGEGEVVEAGDGVSRTAGDADTGATADVVDGANAAAGAADAVLKAGADGMDAAAKELGETEEAIAAEQLRESKAAFEGLRQAKDKVKEVGEGVVEGWEKKGGFEGIQEEAERSWQGAWSSYDRMLRKHYLKMSFLQATALGVVGDSLAQRLERRWNPGQRFDLRRTAHAGVLNMVIDGLFTPRWYNLVEHVSEERTLPIAFVKAIAASTVYNPFANGLFLAGARALHYGPNVRFDWGEWRRQLLVCTVRDFEMWPPLHVLSFWLLPKHWRPLANHVAGVALLAVISSTGLTDAGLPLGQRTAPLLLRWARAVGKVITDRIHSTDKRIAGALRTQ